MQVPISESDNASASGGGSSVVKEDKKDKKDKKDNANNNNASVAVGVSAYDKQHQETRDTASVILESYNETKAVHLRQLVRRQEASMHLKTGNRLMALSKCSSWSS